MGLVRTSDDTVTENLVILLKNTCTQTAQVPAPFAWLQLADHSGCQQHFLSSENDFS